MNNTEKGHKKGQKGEYPLQKGDVIELTVSGLNHQGEGVGRYQGLAVFVPFALPGDCIRCRIVETKKRYARGQVTEFLTTAQERVGSECPAYGRCGGCHLQHYDYPRQLEFKQNIVKEALQRIGGLDKAVVLPTLGMEIPYQYRNKAEYPVQVIEGRVESGFFAPMTRNLVILACECPIQHPLLEKTRKAVMELVNGDMFQDKFREAGLNHLVVRAGTNTGEVMVIFVVEKTLKAGDMLGQLRGLVPEIVSVFQKVGKGPTGNRNTPYELLAGKSTVRERVGSLNFDVSPGAFFQVNTRQGEILFLKTVDYAHCRGVALDAYCGTGSISLFLAQEAERVYGIESFPAAVEDAKHNAAINGIENAEFILGDAARMVELVRRKNPDVVVEAVILDPPRAGCDTEVLDGVVQLGPERIVYVSCNPATLARDLKILAAGGYVIEKVQPIDMFPQTYHVETCVLLSHKKSQASSPSL